MGGRYRSEPVVVDGERFASKIEARRYGELCLLERAGEIIGLVCHPAFEVKIGGVKFCTYTADFAYGISPDQGDTVVRVIEEVKSKATRKDPAYRLRRKAAELFHGIKVTEVVR